MSLPYLQNELLPKLNNANFACYSTYTNLPVKEKYEFLKEVVKSGFDHNWMSFMDTLHISCNEDDLLLSCVPECVNPVVYFSHRKDGRMGLDKVTNVYGLLARILEMEDGEKRLDSLIIDDRLNAGPIWYMHQDDALLELATILNFMIVSNASYIRIEGSKE